MAIPTINPGDMVGSTWLNMVGDFLNLFLGRTAWSVVWEADSGTPAINSGTIRAWRLKLGILCFYSLRIDFAADTALGTGNWRFLMPVTPADAFFPTAVAKAGNVSGGSSTTYVGAVENNGATYFQIGTHGATSVWGAATPFAWGDGDTLWVAGWYWCVL